MPRFALSLSLLALALAPACSTAGPPEGAAPATPAVAQPAATDVAHDWYGLTLGQSEGADIAAWIEARGLRCEVGPALARASHQARCRDDLQPSLLPDRRISGQVRSLLLSRPDDGPLHHVSTLRRYSIPRHAVADYDAAVAALEARFGPPDAPAPVTDPDRLTGALARWATEWTRTDLRVRVSIMKGAGDHISVTETWEVPGVEARIASRPGVSGHGAGAPARNPHILDSTSADL